ncbi:hypothetical protein ACIRQH_39740 [Streptomyces sp. NPDC102279]|uniref:hypothetical protein n=1 Tax=Streptomyces sp. NPDC102279 TaxID=3366153 RepID=UPI0037FCC85E
MKTASALAPSPQRASEVLDAPTSAVHAFTGGNDIDDDQGVLILTATTSTRCISAGHDE